MLCKRLFKSDHRRSRSPNSTIKRLYYYTPVPQRHCPFLRGNPSDSAGLGLKPQSTVITGYNGTLAQSQATWVLYYGRFCQSVMDYIARHIDLYLAKWVTRKYKRGHGSLVQAYE